MAKHSNSLRNTPTSVKLTADLKRRVNEVISLRDITMSSLIADLLEEYLRKNPLSKEEKAFIDFKAKSKEFKKK
jgi:hypothetical protein